MLEYVKKFLQQYKHSAKQQSTRPNVQNLQQIQSKTAENYTLIINIDRAPTHIQQSRQELCCILVAEPRETCTVFPGITQCVHQAFAESDDGSSLRMTRSALKHFGTNSQKFP